MTWFNLIPRWVLVVVIASLMATLFLLKLENTQLSIEIEKGKTYVAKIEAAVAESNAIAQKTALAHESKAREAEAAARSRERVLAADLRTASTELERLSHAATSYTLSRRAATLAPNLDAPDLYEELFLDCGRRYKDVAGEADQWKSDAIKLYEAWPGGRIEQH